MEHRYCIINWCKEQDIINRIVIIIEVYLYTLYDNNNNIIFLQYSIFYIYTNYRLYTHSHTLSLIILSY